MQGKKITIFLMDGETTGRVKCSLGNWTGVAYKIPRLALEECSDITCLKQSGVYILFGGIESDTKPVIYVGQAVERKNGEGLLSRLLEHKRNPDKDYWNEAIVLTTNDNHLGPTEVSYLENRFCNLAKETNRCIVKNGNEPNPGNVTEETKCELEEFMDYAKVIIGTLGKNVFEPLTSDSKPKQKVYYLKRHVKRSNKTVTATLKQTNEGFVVRKDSMIEKKETVGLPASIKALRDTAKISSNGILLEDVLISSPSYAASFVLGGIANGLTEWKTAKGKSMKDIEEGK